MTELQGIFVRGQRITHRTKPEIVGTVLMGPHMSTAEVAAYLVAWDDWPEHTAQHTQEFIEEYYVLKE